MATTLTPIYPSTEGLQQASWRKLCTAALALLTPDSLIDYFCPSASSRWSAKATRTPLSEALRYLHQPPPAAAQAQLAIGAHPFQQRLAFEELLAHQLSMLRLREQMRSHGAPHCKRGGTLQRQFMQQLSFELTAAQRRVSTEIAHDLQQPAPMLRLVQGDDVGSGKDCVVAALARCAVIASGYQVALMASPTEILAGRSTAIICRAGARAGLDHRLVVGQGQRACAPDPARRDCRR